MSRISKYQEGILKFLKDKSFINNTTDETKKILNELLKLSDHIPAILCLTILNTQCKKYNIKIHGYYLAAGIDVMMLLAKVCSNREYFDDKYGSRQIDNMISEVNSMFATCIIQNIETLRLSKNGNINNCISKTCIEYASRYIHKITRKNVYLSTNKVKKTDLLCMNFSDSECVDNYKKKKLLNKKILLNDINLRYGSVCKLAICLGWLLGQGDIQHIIKLENMAEKIGLFLKIHDDFKYIERDMKFGTLSTNYVVNYGIKEAWIELIETRTEFTEKAMNLNIYTKTCKEIVDLVNREIESITDKVSVDMETQYDDISTIN